MIRVSRPEDINQLHHLMHEFAKFDGSEEEFTISPQDLHNALFNATPLFESIVVELDSQLVGFMNYFMSFGTFNLTPTLWVEDVYLIEAYRKRGIGSKIFEYIRKVAASKGISRIEWLVRKNNPIGQKFYDNLGAKIHSDTVYVEWIV